MEGAEGSQEANTSPTQQLDGLEPSPHCHRCPPFKISLNQFKSTQEYAWCLQSPKTSSRAAKDLEPRQVRNPASATQWQQKAQAKGCAKVSCKQLAGASWSAYVGITVTYVTIFHKIMIDYDRLRCITVSQAFSKARQISVLLMTPRPPIRPQHGQGRSS